MKRYEKMSKEEIMQFFLTDCSECKLSKYNGSIFCENYFDVTCNRVKEKYLTAEIQMKSRWELCHTDEDFIRFFDEAEKFCEAEIDCYRCRFHEECDKDRNSFIKAYGIEKVEAEE